MANLVNLPDWAHSIRYSHGIIDDFYLLGEVWTDTSGDASASWSVNDGEVGGQAKGLTGATDNNEAMLHLDTEVFKFAAGKPIWFEAYVKFTEANTDDANIWVGFMDAGGGADVMTDNGGGPKSSYSGVGFFKVDGSTRWQVENSISTTQKTTDLSAANSLTGAIVTAGGAFQRLRIECIPTDATHQDIMFYVDDDLVAKHSDQSISSATDMEVNFVVKAGDTNEETLYVDYVAAFQKR